MFAIEHISHQGHEAIRLVAPDRSLEATFLPRLGMLGASLLHRGEELLGRTDNLARYASEGSTMGIPLLHPWANRLGGSRYDAAGVPVQLDAGSPLLHLDGNGLPIHGVIGARLPWRVAGLDVALNGCLLRAQLDYDTPELLAVFPFPHRLEQEVRLGTDALTVVTTLAPTGNTVVPVCFGYHPYLTLRGSARAEWRVDAPALRRLVLDERSLPAGREERWPGLAGELDRDYDDGFSGVTDGAEFALAGAGRRIAVTFLEGYAFAQIYAPEGKDFVSFEPMTAPANALVSGDGLTLAEPGALFTASFRISVAAVA
jgi:galactose mutarotase-like enzyme